MNILHNDINSTRADLIDLLDDIEDDVELTALLKSIKKTDTELYDIMLLLQSHINTDKLTNRNNFIKIINKLLDIQSNTILILESNNITYSKTLHSTDNNTQNPEPIMINKTENKSQLFSIFVKEPKLLYMVFFTVAMVVGFVIYEIDPSFANILTQIELPKK